MGVGRLAGFEIDQDLACFVTSRSAEAEVNPAEKGQFVTAEHCPDRGFGHRYPLATQRRKGLGERGYKIVCAPGELRPFCLGQLLDEHTQALVIGFDPGHCPIHQVHRCRVAAVGHHQFDGFVGHGSPGGRNRPGELVTLVRDIPRFAAVQHAELPFRKEHRGRCVGDDRKERLFKIIAEVCSEVGAKHRTVKSAELVKDLLLGRI